MVVVVLMVKKLIGEMAWQLFTILLNIIYLDNLLKL